MRRQDQELKIKWTQSLKKCRAASLNPTTVKEFYNLLEELVRVYNIPPENIWNMDEKGVQLGVGGSIAAIVDRDHRTANIEDGNREHVMIIETVSADGKTLNPSVIFQGKRLNGTWLTNNTCNASCV
jgi:hypothetical protein